MPAWGNGQLEGEWEGEPLITGNTGAVQGTPQDPHHLNAENYDMVNYPPPPGVSNCIPECSFDLINSWRIRIRQFNTCIPMEDLPKGPENTSKSFPLCALAFLPAYILVSTFRCRRINQMICLPTLLLALSQTLTKPLFLMCQLTPPLPFLTSKQERETRRISDGSPVVTCAIPLHRFI